MMIDLKIKRTAWFIVAVATPFAEALSAAPATKPLSAATVPIGNAVHGKTFYQSCTGCHSIDENDVGPKHRGVVGRQAGVIPGYAYSSALKKSGLAWTLVNLDRWLTNPQKMVPGTKMYFSVSNSQNRADIIAYLATQR